MKPLDYHNLTTGELAVMFSEKDQTLLHKTSDLESFSKNASFFYIIFT
jgi:hypothetical protein